MDGIYGFLRTAGPSLSPFNAWVLLKGLETLKIRMEAQSRSALELARWLESHPRVRKVYYPGLSSHPQYKLAAKQQRSGGAVVSFEVHGDREAAWKVVDSTRLISITANLGDTKTTITHPATTTHSRISPEARARAGVTRACSAWRWGWNRRRISARIWSAAWAPSADQGSCTGVQPSSSQRR